MTGEEVGDRMRLGGDSTRIPEERGDLNLGSVAALIVTLAFSFETRLGRRAAVEETAEPARAGILLG